MRIVIITEYWKKSLGGGIRTYLTNLVEELKKRDKVEVKVIFREGEDEENIKINMKPQASSIKRYFGFLLFSIRAFFILEKLKPDVIHTHEYWFCLLPGYLYKKIHKVILTHTFHSEPYKRYSLLKKLFFQILINSCDYVTFVSKGLHEYFRDVEKLKFKKMAITYSGVKVGKVSKDEIKKFYEKFNIKNNSTILLLLGFTAIKIKEEGAKLVIRSIKKLMKKYPNIILILTRRGKYYTELKNFVRKENIDKNVIFTGDVKNPFVPLSICDIFIFPWLGRSGVGIALLEAMAMGKPIIATGGVSEVIDNGINGILVKPNVDEIAEKIEYLLKNRKIAEELGRNAKKKVEEVFSWAHTADIFLNIFEKSK